MIFLLTTSIQFLYLQNITAIRAYSVPDVVVVSPKNWGKTCRSLAGYLDVSIAIIDYPQDDATRNEGYIIGDVEGKSYFN